MNWRMWRSRVLDRLSAVWHVLRGHSVLYNVDVTSLNLSGPESVTYARGRCMIGSLHLGSTLNVVHGMLTVTGKTVIRDTDGVKEISCGRLVVHPSVIKRLTMGVGRESA